MPTTVRKATLLDLLGFIPLGEAYHKEAQNHGNFPLSLDQTLQNAARAIMCEDSVILLAFSDGDPAGFIWGGSYALPWSDKKLAMDTLLYVKPEHRGTKVSFLLMQAWEKWAKESGAVEVQISIASGIHEDKTCQFYQRLGYHHTGTQYRKEI